MSDEERLQQVHNEKIREGRRKARERLRDRPHVDHVVVIVVTSALKLVKEGLTGFWRADIQNVRRPKSP